MNWKAFSSRLLLVVVAFPVLGVLIFLAPGLHLLPYTIAVVAASVVGALETRGLFRARGITTTPYLAPFLAGTLPLSVWLEVTGMIPSGWARAWLVACIGVILVRAILSERRPAHRGVPFLHVVLCFHPAVSIVFSLMGCTLHGAAAAVAVHPSFSRPRVRQRHGRLLRGKPLGRLHAVEPGDKPPEERGGVHCRAHGHGDHLHDLPSRCALSSAGKSSGEQPFSVWWWAFP